MRFYPGDSDHQPLGHVGRVPVFAATIFAALYVIGMVVTVIIRTVGGDLSLFIFSTQQFYGHGWLWQPFTCTFVNGPNFFFVFSAIFSYQFGVEYERFFGRRTYLILNALLLATIVLVLGAWHFAGSPGEHYSMYTICIGLIVAYATLYPNLEYLGWVPFKFIAFACIFIDSLNYLGQVIDWHGLSVMLAICGVSFGFTRYKKLGGSLEIPALARRLNPFRRRPKFRVLPSPEGSGPRGSFGESAQASVDAILDKIAQKGFASLTQTERDQLEKAREILNKKRQ